MKKQGCLDYLAIRSLSVWVVAVAMGFLFVLVGWVGWIVWVAQVVCFFGMQSFLLGRKKKENAYFNSSHLRCIVSRYIYTHAYQQIQATTRPAGGNGAVTG